MKILKWHFFLSLVGMYVQKIMEIALCVLEFRLLVQNGAPQQILEGNRSQSGRSMKNLKDAFCLLAIEILCANLRDFWTENGGALSRNVFWTNPPAGGAITDQCEKCGYCTSECNTERSLSGLQRLKDYHNDARKDHSPCSDELSQPTGRERDGPGRHSRYLHQSHSCKEEHLPYKENTLMASEKH